MHIDTNAGVLDHADIGGVSGGGAIARSELAPQSAEVLADPIGRATMAADRADHDRLEAMLRPISIGN